MVTLMGTCVNLRKNSMFTFLPKIHKSLLQIRFQRDIWESRLSSSDRLPDALWDKMSLVPASRWTP